MDGFIDCFNDLEDPRASNWRHDLTEVLFVALLSALCGASNCSEMAEFGRAKEQLLRRFLVLEYGIPSHDTFSRLFRQIDPVRFEAAFRRFMTAFAKQARISKPKGVVALDGKALRHSYEAGQAHMPKVVVTAWAAETRMTLGCRLAPGNNEAAGGVELIELLSLKSCVVTADALHCHRKMAQTIVDQGGDYVLAVKENQPALVRDAKAALKGAGRKVSKALQSEKNHGREETRYAIVAPAPEMAQKHNFKALKAVARVTSKRGQDDLVERTFLMSKQYSPEQVLQIVRSHWGIENTLHWSLDVTLLEDDNRSRKDHAPANLAVLRRLAFNVAKAHPDQRTPLKRKLLKAAWNEDFLLELIAICDSPAHRGEVLAYLWQIRCVNPIGCQSRHFRFPHIVISEIALAIIGDPVASGIQISGTGGTRSPITASLFRG